MSSRPDESRAAPPSVRVATLTLSDTRTPEDDEGGRRLGDLLRGAGFEVVSHEILREEPELLRAAIERIADERSADAIIATGGTGIAPRDRTIEALAPLLEKILDGFGEAFRRLSWDEIGPNAILSRALAGVARGLVVVALPGSPKAIDLAVKRLIAPVLAHAVALASGRGGHHHAHRGAAHQAPTPEGAAKADPRPALPEGAAKADPRPALGRHDR